jgi:hypothetical protein
MFSRTSSYFRGGKSPYKTSGGQSGFYSSQRSSKTGRRSSSALSSSFSMMKLGGYRRGSSRGTRSGRTRDHTNHHRVTRSTGECDACDGDHPTAQCPHYKGKKREKHRDAQRGKPPEIGSGSGGNFVLRNARIIRQPGDGSCLFHSLSYGMGGPGASALRREIASFIAKNPSIEIADSPLSDWIAWAGHGRVDRYARRMARGGWGGGIEMAACSRLKRINVHVYERSRGLRSGFKRISCFNAPGARKTVHILYGGRVHYDALRPLKGNL